MRYSSEPDHGLAGAASGVSGSVPSKTSNGVAVDVKELHVKIGQLTLESDFLSGALGRAHHPTNRARTLTDERNTFRVGF